MVLKLIPASVGKRISCVFAFSGILLSVGVFSLATAETPETKVVKPVRILLSDDTPDDTLSVRRKAADQRNLDKLYNNELRPKNAEPKKVVEPQVKSKPLAEIVTPEILSPNTETPATDNEIETIPQTKSEKKDPEPILNTLTFPKFDLLGDIESAFAGIEKELSAATTSTGSNNTFRHNSKMKHPGSFTPHHMNKTSVSPFHFPTIGSLDGIQFPKIKFADFNSLFGANADPLPDEAEKNTTTTLDKPEEPVKSVIEEKQSETSVKGPRSIIAFLGLDDLAIPELNNPFAVGTGIKETERNVELTEAREVVPAVDEDDIEPDETITSELPSLNTVRPVVPGVKQIPTLAPKQIPEAPSRREEQDKSASRLSPYKTLVNPDSLLPQRSAFPVSFRIGDSANR